MMMFIFIIMDMVMYNGGSSKGSWGKGMSSMMK